MIGELAEASLKLDQFKFGALYEKYLMTSDEDVLMSLKNLMRDYVHNYIEFSLDYAQSGFYGEAIDFINIHIANKESVFPTAQYFHAYYHHLNGLNELALSSLKKAEGVIPDFCFPNKLEELIILQYAVSVNIGDAKAYHYLGNFWYGARQYDDAIESWEKSRELDNKYPTVHRNLALGCYNKKVDPQKARIALETAYDLDKTDARILMELDQLYKKLGESSEYRLELLESNLEAVEYGDDLYLERVSLLNLQGKFEQAMELVAKRKFHPWEGGEGKVSGQFLYALTDLAKQAIKNGSFKKAIELLNRTETYPHNLGEGKLDGAQENDIHYWMGTAYEGLGDMESARKYWDMASKGLAEPTAALYYDDQQPDKIFYQGLALEKLGKVDEARGRYNR